MKDETASTIITKLILTERFKNTDENLIHEVFEIKQKIFFCKSFYMHLINNTDAFFL